MHTCASTCEFEYITLTLYTHAKHESLRKILVWKPVQIMGTFKKQEGCFKFEANLSYSMRPCLSKHH